MVTKEEVIEVLKKVEDPELNLDVWTLGLIYDIAIADDGVDILMTLTSPFCPYADEMVGNVEQSVAQLVAKKEGVEPDGRARVDVTFDPLWKPTDELRATLGI